MDRSFRGKIIAVIILSAAVIITFVFFLFTKDRQMMTDTAAVTAAASASASATASSVPIETPEPTPMPTPTETPAPTPDTVSDDSLIRIVNAAHPLSADYVPAELQNVDVLDTMQAGQQQLRSEAAASLESMFNAAMQDDVYLFLFNGYQSSSEVDNPGESEHPLGLAADIGNFNRQCEKDTCFVKYVSYIWLSEHSYEYGWIERYPKEKEDITGVSYKPWHYRYVGIDEAKAIHDSGLTMEEYFGVSASES